MVVKHNGHMLDGRDSLLFGINAFLKNIGAEYMVIFVTSRTEKYKSAAESFLKENGIRFDRIIYGAPYGERTLVNDMKPSGMKTAIAINTKRDNAAEIDLAVNFSL